jgi:hypothetical protein
VRWNDIERLEKLRSFCFVLNTKEKKEGKEKACA